MSRWMFLAIIKLVYIMPIVNLKSSFLRSCSMSTKATVILTFLSLSLTAGGLQSAKARSRRAGIPAIRVYRVRKKSAHPLDERAVAAKHGSRGMSR
jgi:hypothetical protein